MQHFTFVGDRMLTGTVVSGPYLRAISAGSALVPASAARSDAVAAQPDGGNPGTLRSRMAT
jgi:hypothetical protein